MRCVVCNHTDTKVVDSRISTEGGSIRRRRECEKCGFRFSTLEEVELLGLTVVKRNGAHEQYSRTKIEAGLKKALEKRPHTDVQFSDLVKRIERDIQKKKQGELTSGELGEIVMRHLKSFDKIAYIRFASVYQSFDDLRPFEKLLKDLLQKPKKQKRRPSKHAP